MLIIMLFFSETSNSKLTVEEPEVPEGLNKYWPNGPIVKPQLGAKGLNKQFIVVALGLGFIFKSSWFVVFGNIGVTVVVVKQSGCLLVGAVSL